MSFQTVAREHRCVLPGHASLRTPENADRNHEAGSELGAGLPAEPGAQEDERQASLQMGRLPSETRVSNS